MQLARRHAFDSEAADGASLVLFFAVAVFVRLLVAGIVAAVAARHRKRGVSLFFLRRLLLACHLVSPLLCGII